MSNQEGHKVARALEQAEGDCASAKTEAENAKSELLEVREQYDLALQKTQEEQRLLIQQEGDNLARALAEIESLKSEMYSLGKFETLTV